MDQIGGGGGEGMVKTSQAEQLCSKISAQGADGQCAWFAI